MFKPVPKLHLTQLYRFSLYVDSSGGPDSCWQWTGYIQRRTGYGVISFNGTEYRAHRVAYFIEHGRINSEQMILHRCDVRACVNPRHLYQGNAGDNARDKSRRGRTPRIYGERNGNSKLTSRQVISIRNMARSGTMRQSDLAKYHGVSEATISYIVNGGRWQKLSDE